MSNNFKLLGIVYSVSLLVGLDPCLNLKKWSSRFSLICGVGLILSTWGNFYTLIRNNNWQIIFSNYKEDYLNTLGLTTAILSSYVIGHWVREFLDSIAAVDKLLKRYVNVKDFKKKTYKCQIALLLFYFVIPLIQELCVNLLLGDTLDFRIISSQVRKFLAAQYLSLVYLLAERFLAINNSIIAATMKPPNVLLLKHQLKELVNAHCRLRMLANMLNYYWGFQIVVVIIGGVTAEFMSTSFEKNNWDFSSGFSILITGFHLFALIVICEITAYRANTCATLLHRCVSVSSGRGLEEQIILYSLHMTHEKIVFSALGCVPLNFSLLTKIISPILSYGAVTRAVKYNSNEFLSGSSAKGRHERF